MFTDTSINANPYVTGKNPRHKQLLFSLILFSATLSACINTSGGGDDEALALLLNPLSKTSTGTSTTPAAGIYLADTVTLAPNHDGSSFRDSAKAVNGIFGNGSGSGSFDVFSLTSTGATAELILEWAGKKVINGVGVDFIVFENPFVVSGANRFMDPAIVEVSVDNVAYCGFAPDYTNTPETAYSQDYTKWSNFAGITPVLYNQSSNSLSVTNLFDPTQSGGDHFDLDNLSDSNTFATGCTTAVRNDIQANGFVYIRIISASARTNPDTAAAFVREVVSNGSDIDGVAARYIANR